MCMHLGMYKWVSVCVCMMGECVWWGRYVCLEKGSGFSVVCKVVWCQVDIFGR